MCGIVGWVSTRVSVSPTLLTRMRDRIAHRGPDGEGLWLSEDKAAGLAHRRLAIVDLTPGGRQPMMSHDERLVITFNGEIYNHHELRDELRAKGWVFRSSSDTEVLLAAYQQWGEDALTRLSGMFALAIYDRERRQLFAARDRAGEKPFFYRHANKSFYFASELKALLEHPEMPREADPVALDHYLAYGYVPRGLCLLKGFAKLPAGHKLRYDLASDRLEVEAYWFPPAQTGDPSAPLDALVEEFEPLLETSVRRQMLADVPVGILLSGGLDSSLVAATAARVSGKVTTFTIGFPGHEAFDESPIAKRLAQDLGTEHIELMAEPNTIDLLPKLAAQFDEPIADSSMIPTYLVSRLVRERAKVALGGDGGDELFGGYIQYGWVERISLARRFGLHHLPLSWIAGRALPLRFAGRKMALRLLDRNDAAITVLRLTEPRLRNTLTGRRGPSKGMSAEDFRAVLVHPWVDQKARAMALDFLTYMCDDILVKVDRSSMLTSLEVRAPLLDPAILDFAFSRMSVQHKVANGGRKLLLRALAKKRLPAWFDSHRKQGFSIPLGAWLRGPWASLLQDMSESAGEGLLSPEGVRSFVQKGRNTDRLAHHMFQLAILELWRREYKVSMSVET